MTPRPSPAGAKILHFKVFKLPFPRIWETFLNGFKPYGMNRKNLFLHVRDTFHGTFHSFNPLVIMYPVIHLTNKLQWLNLLTYSLTYLYDL